MFFCIIISNGIVDIVVIAFIAGIADIIGAAPFEPSMEFSLCTKASIESWFIVSGPVERMEPCEFSSIISDLSMGGDNWPLLAHDNSPGIDERRMCSGTVVAGGGIIPASIVLASFNWLAHCISVEHGSAGVFKIGDGVDDDEFDSSLPKARSAERILLIPTKIDARALWDLKAMQLKFMW